MIKAFNRFDQSFLPIFEKYADDPMDRNILIDASILLNNENPEAENFVVRGSLKVCRCLITMVK